MIDINAARWERLKELYGDNLDMALESLTREELIELSRHGRAEERTLRSEAARLRLAAESAVEMNAMIEQEIDNRNGLVS
jgi:hypothetical protein